MADYIGATPQVNPLMGLLAERLKQAQQFAAKPFGYQNPPAEMLMNLLGVPAVQQTAERLAYGEPLTTGRGMTTQVRPEALEAAMTVAPVAGLLGRGAERGAMAVGRAGERYAEKVVPQIMEQGGLPAQLLGDLSQGSVSRVVPKAKIDELTGLPLNSDGTVTLFHHTNKDAAEQIAKTGRLKSAGEPSVYLTTQRSTDTGYGDVAVPVRVKPSLLNLDDEFPSGRMDFSIDTGKPKGSIPVEVEKQSFIYPQEEALKLAQQRAALPVEQGGLGLLSSNTPAERAAAMGFDTPVYHATEADFTSIRPSATGKMGKGIYTSFDPTYAERYASGDAARTMSLVTRGEMATPEIKSDVSEIVRQQMIQENPDFNVRDWKARSNQALAEQGYSGLDVDKERLMFSPEDLRSRFAAFDPWRRTSAIAAAMGVAAPDLLAEEQKPKKKQSLLD